MSWRSRPNVSEFLYFGRVNPKSIEIENNEIRQFLAENSDLRRLNQVSRKADLKFFKTRQGVGRSSVVQAKRLLSSGIRDHPDFLGTQDPKEAELMKAFSEFKPQRTYFESWKGRRIKNSEKVLKAIEGLKKIERKAAQEEEVKEKIRARHGKSRAQFFELGEERARELTASSKTQARSKYRSKGFLPTFTAKDPSLHQNIEPALLQDQGVFGNRSKALDRDWQMVALTDDTQDLFRIQKKVWNKRKMKYVGVTLNAAGTNLDDYREQLKVSHKRAGKLKKKFRFWKRNQANEIPKIGEREDFSVSQRMRGKFLERKRQKFKTSNQQEIQNKKGKSFHSQKRLQNRGQTSGKKKNRIAKMRKKFRK